MNKIELNEDEFKSLLKHACGVQRNKIYARFSIKKAVIDKFKGVEYPIQRQILDCDVNDFIEREAGFRFKKDT